MYPWNNVPLEFENNKIMNMTGRHVYGPAGAHFGHTALSQHVGRTLKTWCPSVCLWFGKGSDISSKQCTTSHTTNTTHRQTYTQHYPMPTKCQWNPYIVCKRGSIHLWNVWAHAFAITSTNSSHTSGIWCQGNHNNAGTKVSRQLGQTVIRHIGIAPRQNTLQSTDATKETRCQNQFACPQITPAPRTLHDIHASANTITRC